MENIITAITLVFIGLIAGGLYFLLVEPAKNNQQKKDDQPKKEPDILSQYQRKIKHSEQKIAALEQEMEALKLELLQAQGREKELLKERSAVAFESAQFEKLKKDHLVLKSESDNKEAILEKEISLRRSQAVELAQTRSECEQLKKKLDNASDALRRTNQLLETTTKDLQNVKSILHEQKKVVQEHSENKIEGEWVSREEFSKIENELTEKEALIQKLLSLPGQKQPSAHP